MVASAKSVFKIIAMDKIDRPADGARVMIGEEEIVELAESIRERGLLQPILVTPRDGRFEIVAGDRRYLAHEYLGYKKIEAKVVEADEKDVVIDRAIENLQRVDLSPFEEGMIYGTLRDKMGFTVEEIGKKMRKSPGRIERRLSVLRMPESFQKAVHFGKISMGVAEELWSTPDAGKREYFLEIAVEHGVTTAVARGWVNDFKKSLRASESDNEEGTPVAEPFENVPIYRACDICKNPMEYKDAIELRVCPACGEAMRNAVKKPGN